jgi:phage-related protein
MDTKNAAIMLGKALNDPIGGVSALRRVGVQLNDTQEAQVKKLMATNDIMGAQKIILGELKTEVGGSAEAYGKTFAGSLEKLKGTFGNLEEAAGGFLANALQPIIPKFQEIVDTIAGIAGGEADLATLTETLTDVFGGFGTVIGQTIEFFGNNRQALEMLAGVLGGVLSISLIAAAGAMLAFIGVSLPMLAIGAAIGAIAALIITNWSSIVEFLQPVLDFFVGLFNTLKSQFDEFTTANAPLFMATWETIKNAIGAGLIIIKNIWDAVWPSLQQVFSGVWNMIKGILTIAWGVVQMIITVGLALLTGDWSKAWTGIKTAFEDIWTGIKDFLTGTWESIKGIFKGGLNAIVGMLNGFIDVINKAGSVAGVKVAKLPSFDTGGWVPDDMVAVVHRGEFVMSRAMIEGREPAPISSNTNYNTPISLGPIYVRDESDIDLISQRLAFAFTSNGNL